MIPDLRKTYGKRWRVGLDPCATSWKDLLMQVIVGRTGCAYVHGEQNAAIEVDSRRRGSLAAMREAGFPLHLRADDVHTFLVPWERLSEALPIIKPYKRRQLTPEQQEAARSRLREYRESQKLNSRDHENDPESDAAG